MNICIFSIVTFWHGVKGGMEVHGKLLSEGLVKKGHKVMIITTRHPKGIEYEEKNGIKLIYLKNTVFGSRRHNWKRASIKKFIELEKTDKIDIICCQDPIISYRLIVKERKKVIPLVVIIELHKGLLFLSELNQTVSHKTGVTRLIKEFLSFLYYFSAWELPNLQRYDAVISVSNEVSKSIHKLYRVNKRKIFTVYNGVETDYFCPNNVQRESIRKSFSISKNEALLLFFSFITKQKGLHLLIKALPEILKTNNQVKLLVVGEGDYLNEAKQTVKQLRLEKYVIFTGQIPREETSHYINASDVFIMPTLRQEGMPFSILEAMACQKPVIASCIGGIPSIIDNGVNGLLVPPGNISKLIEKILFLLKNKKYADKIATNARKKALSEFSLEKMINETIKVFQLSINRQTVD